MKVPHQLQFIVKWKSEQIQSCNGDCIPVQFTIGGYMVSSFGICKCTPFEELYCQED
jgi:hypothetical protein